jgi:hypothetical protein
MLFVGLTVREVDPNIFNKTLTQAMSDLIANFSQDVTPTHNEFSMTPNWNTVVFDDGHVK